MHRLTAANSKSKTGALHPYYKCCNWRCTLLGKVIKAGDIHTAFYALLETIKPSEEITSLAFAVFEDAWKTWVGNKGSEQKKLASHKSELEESISRLSLMASNPSVKEIVRRQYEKQIENLSTELEAIEETLATEHDYTVPHQTSSKQVEQALKNPYGVWASYDTRKKQRFFSFVFEANLVYSKTDGFQTPNYSLPIRVFEAISASPSAHVEMEGSEPSCNA